MVNYEDTRFTQFYAQIIFFTDKTMASYYVPNEARIKFF